jgi:hypothetical protein
MIGYFCATSIIHIIAWRKLHNKKSPSISLKINKYILLQTLTTYISKHLEIISISPSTYTKTARANPRVKCTYEEEQCAQHWNLYHNWPISLREQKLAARINERYFKIFTCVMLIQNQIDLKFLLEYIRHDVN